MLEKIKKIIPHKLFKALQPAYHYFFSFIAALVYGFPSRNLIVIGITGTTGKTSIVYLIAKMLENAGYKTGFTSTAVFSDGNREWLNDKKMTMPGRFFISRTLKQMIKNKCRYAIIETTSEGIKQFRHQFLNYDILIFSGIYPEHIESHGSFENYKQEKGKLFAHLKNCSTKYINEERVVVNTKSGIKKLDLARVRKTIIINGDDAEANYFLNFWSEAKIVYSFNKSLEESFFTKNLNSESMVKDFRLVRGDEIKTYGEGTSFMADSEPVNLKLLGHFNAINALAAYSLGLNQSLETKKIISGLESVNGLAGKIESIEAGQNFKVIVDYSFEPRALEKLYETISLIPYKRLIHILGSAGGGRDKSRRPVLGRMAGKKADIVIVTNEDPYDENPVKIIEEVAYGAEEAGKEPNHSLLKIEDRRQAIRKALMLAEENDLVLITGKGAEQAICLAGGAKIPWDDRLVAREELERISL